jgi:hypothetical protein
VTLAFAGVLVAVLGGARIAEDFAPYAAAIVVFVVSSVVGGIVASRQPQNPLGWILCGFGAFQGIYALASGYAEVAPDDAASGAGQIAAWFSTWSYVSFFALAIFVLLLFPDGHLPSPRWRMIAWCGAASTAAFACGAALDPGTMEDYPAVENPFGVAAGVAAIIVVAGMLGTIGVLAAAVGSIVVRYRRADGVGRQQIKWLTVAAIFVVVGVVLGLLIAALGREDIGYTVLLLGILGIPVAIGVAILRYRLYEVDRIISRTLVYGSLTTLLGAAYLGMALAGQWVFSSFTGGSDLAIAVSTLVVAALFLPLRTRVQGFIDRCFYRRRYDAQLTLQAFGARLREEVELESLSEDLSGVVAETMQPAHLSLWLRKGLAR